MKHLVIVTDAWTPQINGVVTTMTTMVAEAESRGWKTTVIHPGLFTTVAMPGYKEIRLAVNPWKLASMLPEHFDSLHIVTEGPLGLAARIMCSIKGWQCTTGFHTNFPEYIKKSLGIPEAITYPIFRWFHGRSKAVFVPSQSTNDKLAAKGFQNLLTWSRGYREDIFNPSRKRSDLLTQDATNLVYVGRVSREKNIDAFLDLAYENDAAGKPYSLWVVGDGPDRARLEALGGANFVGFKTGSDLAEYFASADVFVFPSKTDTLGIVNIEAMACGTPVAAYDVEGPKDVIIQGEGGFVGSNLARAVKRALKLRGSPSIVANAELHTWKRSADTFYQNLVYLDGTPVR